MKISSLQENLKSGLFTVGHIAGKNVNLPILSNVLMEAKDGNIKLITTDLEIGIICTVRGKIKNEGVFTVESKVISDYISLLPNQKVDIEMRDNKLIIQSDNYKTVVRGQSAEEFPLIPKVEEDDFYKANIEEFRDALAQVIFAVSNSENRIELSGVFFNFNKENLTLAATDSYRLAEKKLVIKTNAENEKKIIVPAKTLQELIRILSAMRNEDLSGSEKEIKFFISENQILFRIGNCELVSRLIEGQYPDYRQIIPRGKKTKAIINRGDFLRAVKAAAIFSRTGVNDVNLDFPLDSGQIVVSSASGQTGENITKLEAKVEGKDNGIVINHRYLLDGINNIMGENIVLELTDGNTPCTLRPEKDESYLYIIMPIKQ